MLLEAVAERRSGRRGTAGGPRLPREGRPGRRRCSGGRGGGGRDGCGAPPGPGEARPVSGRTDPPDELDGVPGVDDEGRDQHPAPTPAQVRASARAVAALVCGAVSVALVSVVALLPVPFAVESPARCATCCPGRATSASSPSRAPGRTRRRARSTSPPSACAAARAGPWTWAGSWRPGSTTTAPCCPRPPSSRPAPPSSRSTRATPRPSTGSQQAATVAALTELGYDVPVQVVVTDVVDGSGAAGNLGVGDVVTAVDGTAVTDATALRDAVRAVGVGRDADVRVERDGRSRTWRCGSVPGGRGTRPGGAR